MIKDTQSVTRFVRHVRSRFLHALSFLDSYVTRHRRAVLCFGLVLLFLRAFATSPLKPLFRDELLTWVEAQSPSLSALWSGLVHAPAGVDAPLHPIVAFFALRLPLPALLALRFPSAVCYGAAMLSLFAIMCRRAPPTVALLAFAIPMSLPTFDYAVQARPYALLLAFSGWAFALWQRAAEQRNRRFTLFLLLFLCLAGAMWTHYFGICILIPLCAGELWRTIRSGIDRSMWLTFLAGPVVGMILCFPLLPAASAYRVHPWHGVAGSDLGGTYALAIKPFILVVLLLSCWAGLALPAAGQDMATPSEDRSAIQFRDYELVAIVTLFLVPGIVFASALLVTHSYVPRYGIIFSLAAALLMSSALAVLTRRVKGLLCVALALLFAESALPLGALIHHLPKPDSIDSSSTRCLDRFADLPIAVPDFDVYLRFHFFGPDRITRRMVLVSAEPTAWESAYTLALSNAALHRWIGAPNENYQQFIAAHSRFLLIDHRDAGSKILKQGKPMVWVGRALGRPVYMVAPKLQ